MTEHSILEYLTAGVADFTIPEEVQAALKVKFQDLHAFCAEHNIPMIVAVLLGAHGTTLDVRSGAHLVLGRTPPEILVMNNMTATGLREGTELAVEICNIFGDQSNE